jgi:hypothetical protein
MRALSGQNGKLLGGKSSVRLNCTAPRSSGAVINFFLHSISISSEVYARELRLSVCVNTGIGMCKHKKAEMVSMPL